MAKLRLRRQIACEAARLLVRRQESEFYRARLRAARLLSSEPVHPRDMPSRREIREQVEALARRCDNRAADADDEHAGDLPIGDEIPFDALDETAAIADRWPTQEPMADVDRFLHYGKLLVPLEKVMQKPQSHPEGDALYHSLQVFDLARDALPYDEEFLLAALLHDVGKAIDSQDHVGAALEALGDTITPRTAWLIEHHSEANALRDGTLGARARRRLEESEDFDELMLLSRCDRDGRRVGVPTSEVDEALEYIRDLAESCGE